MMISNAVSPRYTIYPLLYYNRVCGRNIAALVVVVRYNHYFMLGLMMLLWRRSSSHRKVGGGEGGRGIISLSLWGWKMVVCVGGKGSPDIAPGKPVNILCSPSAIVFVVKISKCILYYSYFFSNCGGKNPLWSGLPKKTCKLLALPSSSP